MVTLVKARVRHLDPRNLFCTVYWEDPITLFRKSAGFYWNQFSNATGGFEPEIGDEVDLELTPEGGAFIRGFSL